jgi:hypothetical protein
MKLLRSIFVLLILTHLSACGVGKYFIERSVSNIEDDIAKEFKSYAQFNKVQQQQIDNIATQSANWVKTDRLLRLKSELDDIADDIEEGSAISEKTWKSTISFLERPLTMSNIPGLVEDIAQLSYGLSTEQAQDVVEQLRKDHKKALKQFSKNTLDDQNKKFARALKLVFAEMDISRTKAQMDQAHEMLKQRQSHIDLDWQEEQRNHLKFVNLVQDRSLPKSEYIKDFSLAWRQAEQGAKHLAPQKWQHNAQVAYSVMNFLLSDLDQTERRTAAKNIREYAELFGDLSVVEQ